MNVSFPCLLMQAESSCYLVCCLTVLQKDLEWWDFFSQAFFCKVCCCALLMHWNVFSDGIQAFCWKCLPSKAHWLDCHCFQQTYNFRMSPGKRPLGRSVAAPFLWRFKLFCLLKSKPLSGSVYFSLCKQRLTRSELGSCLSLLLTDQHLSEISKRAAESLSGFAESAHLFYCALDHIWPLLVCPMLSKCSFIECIQCLLLFGMPVAIATACSPTSMNSLNKHTSILPSSHKLTVVVGHTCLLLCTPS